MNLKYGSKVKVTSGFYEGIHYIHGFYVDKDNIPKYSLMNKYGKLVTEYSSFINKEKVVGFPQSSLELIK